jgi:large subunit ribosomal protein L9
MEVILNQDIERLGKAGSIVKVKDGFARNFLIPNDLAVPVTVLNIKKIEEQKQRKVRKLEKYKKEAEELKGKLEGVSLTIPVLTQEGDRLYASVNPQDISAALKEEGFDIDKNSIVMDDQIRSLGIFEASVELHPEVLAKIKVWVVKK